MEKKKKVTKSNKTKKTIKKEPVKKPLNKVDLKKETKYVWAYAKYVDISAQKLRLIVDKIRSKDTETALSILLFLRKRGTRPVMKLLNSAIANATNNFEMDKKNLVIDKIFVDDAPIYKRWTAGSRGRYEKTLRRNSHISICLKEK